MPSFFDLMDDPPSQAHSPTSVAAAKAVKPRVPGMRAQVLQLIHDAGDAGLTDDQLIAITGKQGARPRRIELVRDGLVVDSGKTRKTASRCQAVVWIEKKG